MTRITESLAATSRRSFLKATGFAAAAAVLDGSPANAEAAASASDSSAAAKSGPVADPLALVNVLQGTDSTPYFSRGNTLPIATRPFGMAHWTLQSTANSPWMFHPGERRLQGLRSTHQLSPWLYDYGFATFLPFCGDINPEAAARASSYRPEDAKLAPNSLRFQLLRYGIDVELIPTERCALITAQFSKNEAPGFLFDILGEHGDVQPDASARTIGFTSTANSGGVPDNFATYYALRFAKPWQSFEVKELKGHRVGIVRFAATDRAIDVRIGTSFISFEQAFRNLDNEIGSHSADELRADGARVWNEHLRRIEVEGGTEEQQRTFYSCMYRTLLFPRMWHEPDADGKMHHFSAFNGKVVPGVMYADHGYWDVYRAWYPMMTILFPERLGEILQAWVNAYQEGGWLPQFPCPGYRACMSGSLIDSVFGDAAVKGIGGFDLKTAYAGLKKHATQVGDPDKGFGRTGIEFYLKYNFVPADKIEQSAVETADAAYGDFCIAQVAKAVGNQEDYEYFMRRSENWRQIFDRKTGFIRGKNSDGSWVEPFDPFTWGSPYEEGAAWQHRWDVPHNIPGVIQGLGGNEKAVAVIEQMLSSPATFNVGVYGQEIHEMSEMAAVPFGQYAHSNQPVHHVLYIFTAAGRPDLTRHWTGRIMRELYSSNTFAGDEDTGSMAAWFILSSLGFYQLCPGKPEYSIGGPFFPKATVRLPGGKSLVVESGSGGAESASLNGNAVADFKLQHAELIQGGRLRFTAPRA
jgi:predicted alpha-1,2-mannosidase